MARPRAERDRGRKKCLEPLLDRAELRIVHCEVDAAVAWERARQRVSARAAHAVGPHVHELEAWTQLFTGFERISIDAPSLTVDTTDGYAPDLHEIAAYVVG